MDRHYTMAELLAPAGGMLQLKTAVRFGADAVYGGLQSFGLRAFAGNFTFEELEEALNIVHGAGKKFYLTLNVLPYEDELDDFCAAAAKAFELGIDAAIVSDLGAFLRLRKTVPELPIHISTQANTMNGEACRFYYEQGAQRVVLAREVSLSRIAALRKSLPDGLEIEAFVHGAMCMSHSGRCMLSDHLAGRGGNRGACAQPCRWNYALVEQKRPGVYMPVEEDERGTYILSAYDLNMINHLPEMMAAGICSLKIEGRMKTEYYVANVVSAYRRALDLIAQSEQSYRAALPYLNNELLKASHRLSNTGFYYGAPTPPSGADGIMQDMAYIGRIESWENGTAKVSLKNRFYVGDTLELLSPKGVFPFVVQSIRRLLTDEAVDTVSIAGESIEIPLPFPAEEGDFLRGPNRNNRKC